MQMKKHTNVQEDIQVPIAGEVIKLYRNQVCLTLINTNYVLFIPDIKKNINVKFVLNILKLYLTLHKRILSYFLAYLLQKLSLCRGYALLQILQKEFKSIFNMIFLLDVVWGEIAGVVVFIV